MKRKWLLRVVVACMVLALVAFATLLLQALRPAPSTKTQHYARAVSYGLTELSRAHIRMLRTDHNAYFVYRLSADDLRGFIGASDPAVAARARLVADADGVVTLVVPRIARENYYGLPEFTWARPLVRCLDFTYTFSPPAPRAQGDGPWFTCLSGDNGEAWREAHTFDLLGFSLGSGIEPMMLAHHELRNGMVHVWPE